MPTCPICFSSFQPGQYLVSCTLTPQHTVHSFCDIQHRNLRPCCAICRDPGQSQRNYVLEQHIFEGTVPHVVDDIQLRNGCKYLGEWSDDRPHGQGRMVMPSGLIFKGEFRRGYPDGRRYLGELL